MSVDVVTEVVIERPVEVVAGFARVAAPFMSPAIRRANTNDLAALRRILESR